MRSSRTLNPSFSFDLQLWPEELLSHEIGEEIMAWARRRGLQIPSSFARSHAMHSLDKPLLLLSHSLARTQARREDGARGRVAGPAAQGRVRPGPRHGRRQPHDGPHGLPRQGHEQGGQGGSQGQHRAGAVLLRLLLPVTPDLMMASPLALRCCAPRPAGRRPTRPPRQRHRAFCPPSARESTNSKASSAW